MPEILDVYDAQGRRTGKTRVRGEDFGPGEYHLIACAVVRNAQGKLLFSRRAPEKNFAGLWEASGGAVQGSTAASGSPAGSSTTGRVSHASNPSHDAILSLFDVPPISSSASAPVIAQGADAPAPNTVPGLIPQHSRKAASFSLGAKSPRPPSEAAFDSLLQL